MRPTRAAAVRLLAVLMLSGSAAARAEVDFNREVRPILSDKCFHCHGPDEATRKGKLRLDTREGALRVREGVAAITPGKTNESELLQRILSPHEDEVMPPPESKLGRLSAAEADVLRRWIEEGAAYRAHWSFEKLAPVPVPVPAAGTPPERNAIDAFVFHALAARKLAPQPEADRATLLRRVSFDLTGLPPTPAATAAFLADPRPDAYERAVDTLLASPRYGERMAADWLDVARYADSYGFQVDRERDMWPWRDWVIRSFNANLPWDKFVTWQLAGDLLPGATDEQILATAFNRLHPQESEGGSVEEEYRVNHVNDRTTTFGTAFLGLTLDCARCHDHKFDPISQKEYYQLFAFFDDIDEAGLYSFFTPSVPTPNLRLTDDAYRRRHQAATAAVREAEGKLVAVRRERQAAFEAWLAAAPIPGANLPGEIARFSFDERLPAAEPPPANASKPTAETPAPADSGKPKPDRFASALDPQYVATTARDNVSVPGRIGHALKLTGDHVVNTPLGNFHRHDPFSVALWIQTPDVKERAVVMHRSKAWTDSASRGYELLIEDGRLKWSLIHFWPGDAISIRTTAPAPVGRWLHVTVTSDGSGHASGLRILVDGETAATEVIRDHLTKDITGSGGDTISLGERFRDRGFKDGLVDELRVFNRALTPAEVREIFAPGSLAKLRTSPESAARAELFEAYLSAHDEAARQAAAELTAARAALTAIDDEVKEIMVMRDMARPKRAYVLRRGEYDQRGEEVEPGTPAALPAFPADLPRNRLGLARWVTRPDHPLLARVTVNRFWQASFGRGLVKTPEDFGSQGDRGDHPALLDWLATEFVRTGWDVKALLRTIVTSHTYRQRSFAPGPVMADDPENALLARGPRHRLPAEMIRDNALAVSGLLVERVGGPPVFTYDLPESFKPAPAGKGEDLYRRSVYTFWRRNGPAPVLEAFDLPKRVVCVVRRDTTNTPLHALVLLNGRQFVEAARVLAERLHREHAGDRDAIVADAFARLACRAPDATERRIVAQLYDEQLAWFTRNPGDADCHLNVGDTPADGRLPAPAVAAAAVTINALMNHDAFVVKR